MLLRKDQIFPFLKRLWENTQLFLHASLADQFYQHARKDLARKEDFFFIICFGDMIGMPTPTYLTMRLLPFILQDIPKWRQRMSRERNRFWEAWEEFMREL
ncbi:MAG: hypothetical protein ONB45_20245 [candidate division KSB1 bacterium]|nr:hypothetical protein [candidate division KSB1 bacterium]